MRTGAHGCAWVRMGAHGLLTVRSGAQGMRRAPPGAHLHPAYKWAGNGHSASLSVTVTTCPGQAPLRSPTACGESPHSLIAFRCDARAIATWGQHRTFLEPAVFFPVEPTLLLHLCRPIMSRHTPDHHPMGGKLSVRVYVRELNSQ